MSDTVQSSQHLQVALDASPPDAAAAPALRRSRGRSTRIGRHDGDVRRRWLAAAGAAVLVSGLVVALKPSETSFGVLLDGKSLMGSSRCGVPIQEASRRPRNDGWFAHAPGINPVLSEGFGCQAPARRRAAVGTVLTIIGSAIVVLACRRRTPLPPVSKA